MMTARPAPRTIKSLLTALAAVVAVLASVPSAQAAASGDHAERVRAAANGCGGHDTEYIPDDFPGVFNFRSACDKHDDCYATPERTKKSCDRAFLRNMVRSCRSRGYKRLVLFRGRKRTCYKMAVIYFGAKVSRKARTAYEEAQRGAEATPPEQGDRSPFEPNGSPQSAYGPLRLGVNYDGAIETAGDVDWFILRAPSRQRITGAFLIRDCATRAEPEPELCPPGYAEALSEFKVPYASANAGLDELVLDPEPGERYLIRVTGPPGFQYRLRFENREPTNRLP